jgi:rod shape-determining protein MreD
LKAALTFILVIVTGLLQVSLFGHWRPLGVEPNLMLLIVVLFGLLTQATSTLGVAIAGGLLLDLTSGPDFGLRTAFFTALALTVIAARQFGLHADSFISAAAMVLGGTILFNLAIVLSSHAIMTDWTFVSVRIGREIILNLIILVIFMISRSLVRDRRARVTSELRRGSWV